MSGTNVNKIETVLWLRGSASIAVMLLESLQQGCRESCMFINGRTCSRTAPRVTFFNRANSTLDAPDPTTAGLDLHYVLRQHQLTVPVQTQSRTLEHQEHPVLDAGRHLIGRPPLPMSGLQPTSGRFCDAPSRPFSSEIPTKHAASTLAQDGSAELRPNCIMILQQLCQCSSLTPRKDGSIFEFWR